MTQDLCCPGERCARNAGTPRRITRAVRHFLFSGLIACASLSAFAADLSGYWTLDLKRSELAVDTQVLTSAAQERLRTFNPTRHDPTSVCMPYGMPRVMTALGAFPMEIVQSDSQVTMLFDAHDEVRRVMLNAKPRIKEELAPL